MKTEKSDLLRKKPETRGRKKDINPSIQVSWRIKYDIHQLLEKERVRIEKETGVEVGLSKVLEACVKKCLK